MFGGKGGMGNIMKQAQEMQERMQKVQEEAAKAEVQGESGAGMVKVTMNGRHDVARVEIDPSLMEEDKELLEDLLADLPSMTRCARSKSIPRSRWKRRLLA